MIGVSGYLKALRNVADVVGVAHPDGVLFAQTGDIKQRTGAVKLGLCLAVLAGFAGLHLSAENVSHKL